MEPLKLPPLLVSQSDVTRLIRELNGLNDYFVAAKNRTTGTTMQLPRLTRLLDLLAHENDVNLLEETGRNNLLKGLQEVYDKAPSMHISFAIDPSPKALEKILVWMRQNVHPQALLSIGLQPAIAAGCVLRTTNKVFDMSLRTNLKKQSGYLTQLIRGAADGSN